MSPEEKAWKDICTFLPQIESAMKTAEERNPGAEIHLGILAIKPKGKIVPVAKFNGRFVEDLRTLINYVATLGDT